MKKLFQFKTIDGREVTRSMNDITHLTLSFDLMAKQYWGYVVCAKNPAMPTVQVQADVIEKLAKELMPPEVHQYD